MTNANAFLAIESVDEQSVVPTRLVIQDGAGGLTDYQLAQAGWTPNVAQYSRALIGTSPLETVSEELELNIRGTSGSDVLTKLAALENLLVQAERWAAGEAVPAVMLAHAPRGSAVATRDAPYRVALLGRGGGGSLLDLPPQVTRAGDFFYIPGVRVRLQRRPQWILGQTAASSGAVANPGLMRVTTLPNLDGLSPIALDIAGLPAVDISAAGGSALYVLTSSSFSGSADNGITILDQPFGTPSAPWSSVADSANAALGGNVLRFTPAGITEQTYLTGLLTTQFGAVAIFAAVRNNGAQTYRIRAGLKTRSSTNMALTRWARPVAIDAATTNPRIICLGVIPLMGGETTAEQVHLGITASAAGGTLDIDYVVAMQIATADCSIIRTIGGMALSDFATAPIWRYDPQLITYPVDGLNFSSVYAKLGPKFEFRQSSGGVQIYNQQVDAYKAPHMTKQIDGTKITIVVLGATGAKWCLSTGTSGASLTATVTRYNAYLIPV